MNIFRAKKESSYIILDSRIIQDCRLSLDGKGIYGMLEAGCMALEEVPENIIKELVEVGYLKEVIE